MFDRFTEKARRSIFFARYEASAHPSSCIEAEHLLLGLFREWPALAERVPAEQFRKIIAEKYSGGLSVSTSVDLPLSREAQRALSRGAEEADRLGSIHIDCGHLVLGLMQESSWIAEWLNGHHIGTTAIEKMLNRAQVRPDPDDSPPQRLIAIVETAEHQLLRFTDAQANATVGKQRRSRKEALGHLIDCAMTHHQWIARALTEHNPVFSGYPQDAWIAAMKYKTADWSDLVRLWASLNQILVHAIGGIAEETTVRVGIEPPTTLKALIDRYIKHLEAGIAEILTFGHSA